MIRRALPDDEVIIRHCAEDAYARYVPRIGRKPAPMVADFAASIERGHLFVADSDENAIVGFVICYRAHGCLFIENVAVFSRHEGQGFGRSLLSFCEERAIGLGLPRLRLYTNAKMTENLEMYPKLGFVETERRHEEGFDRIYFEKALVL